MQNIPASKYWLAGCRQVISATVLLCMFLDSKNMEHTITTQGKLTLSINSEIKHCLVFYDLYNIPFLKIILLISLFICYII